MQVAQNHRGGARVRLHSLQADAQHNGDHRCTVDSAQRRRSTVHSDGVRTMQTLTSSDQHIVIAQLIAMRTSTLCVPGGGDVRLPQVVLSGLSIPGIHSWRESFERRVTRVSRGTESIPGPGPLLLCSERSAKGGLHRSRRRRHEDSSRDLPGERRSWRYGNVCWTRVRRAFEQEQRGG